MKNWGEKGGAEFKSNDILIKFWLLFASFMEEKDMVLDFIVLWNFYSNS